MTRSLRRQFVGAAANESGTAAVEFAIISSAFVAIVLGIIYIGMMLFDLASLQWAVERGARIAALNKSATQSQISTAVNDYLKAVNAPQAQVQYSVDTSGALQVATINASFQKSYTIPFVSTFNINFSATTSTAQGS